MSSVKVGDKVWLEFYDHAEVEEDDGDAPHFFIAGLVTDVTRVAYRIVSWGHTDPKLRETDKNLDDNEVTHMILKSAVTKIRKMP